MVPRYNISLAEEREIALKRLKRICDAGFISVLDFKNNPLRIFAAHELAAMIDPAMATKMTVQVCMSMEYVCGACGGGGRGGGMVCVHPSRSTPVQRPQTAHLCVLTLWLVFCLDTEWRPCQRGSLVMRLEFGEDHKHESHAHASM